MQEVMTTVTSVLARFMCAWPKRDRVSPAGMGPCTRQRSLYPRSIIGLLTRIAVFNNPLGS